MSRCRSCGKPVCGCSDPEYQGVVADLARVKALFQQRAICAVMGINPDSPHPIAPTDDRMNSGGVALSRPASFVDCAACDGSGWRGPYFSGGLRTRCANCGMAG